MKPFRWGKSTISDINGVMRLMQHLVAVRHCSIADAACYILPQTRIVDTPEIVDCAMMLIGRLDEDLKANEIEQLKQVGLIK